MQLQPFCRQNGHSSPQNNEKKAFSLTAVTVFHQQKTRLGFKQKNHNHQLIAGYIMHIKKDRPPKRAIWNMMQPEGLLERGTRKHYCILSITVNYQGCNERHGVILHRKVE